MIISEEAMNTLIDICNNPPEPTGTLKQLLQGDDSLNEIKLNRVPLENTYDGFEQADIFMGCKYNPRKCLACGEEHECGNLPCPNFHINLRRYYMIKEFRGGYSDEAFDCYNLAESNVHIHSLSLYIDEESEDEVVAIGFSHYADEIIGYVNPATRMVELYQVVMNGMRDDEGNPEVIEYGVAELGKLLAELDKMPHISNVLEDCVGNERLH